LKIEQVPDRHLQQGARASAAAGEERARRLRARLPVVVRCLGQDDEVDQVILFGSVASRTCGPRGDLNIAVSGLSRLGGSSRVGACLRVIGRWASLTLCPSYIYC
jgi:hypothetical protein